MASKRNELRMLLLVCTRAATEWSHYGFVVANNEETGAELTPREGRRRVLEVAARLSGAFAAAGTTLVAGPFAGGAAGVAVSESFLRIARSVAPVADEVLAGPLGPREQERAVAVIGFALAEIEGRLEAEEVPRDDGFFEAQEGHRPDGASLLEAVMREGAGSYNEKRVRHLGKLWGSFAFDTRAPGASYYLFDTAQRLTYRQMVTLIVLAEQGDVLPDWEGHSALDAQEPELLAEITHLGRNRLLVRSYGQTIASIDQVNPGDMVPAPLGERLIAGLGLHEVPTADRDEVTQALWRLNASFRTLQKEPAEPPPADVTSRREDA